MHPNYRLEGLTMTLNGGTFTDTHLSSGGPDGGSYFNRNTVAANTSSPMTMDTTPSGTGAIPVTAATSYTLAWWAQKNVVGGPTTRVDVAWYNAGGGLISTSTGTAFASLDVVEPAHGDVRRAGPVRVREAHPCVGRYGAWSGRPSTSRRSG